MNRLFKIVAVAFTAAALVVGTGVPYGMSGRMGPAGAQAEDAPSMNIYGIHLTQNAGAVDDETEEHALGDAVLMESGGHYLLMDTGIEYVTDSVVKYLKKAGVSDLDIYISHMHTDHVYGIEPLLDNFNVGTVYLPDQSIGEGWVSDTNVTIEAIYRTILHTKGVEDKAQQVVYLKKGSTFDMGDVHAEVLGPVGTHSLKYKGNHKNIGSKAGHYLNNNSLTTMFSCGGVKFLTTGDIEEEEEAALVAEYGSKLRADILKMPHHGLDTSSTDAFLSAVKPTWSFAENSGYDVPQKTSASGESYYIVRGFNPLQRYRKVGFAYFVGCEKAAFIAKVAGGKVSLFRDANNNAVAAASEELSGTVKVKGDGIVTGSTPGYYGNNIYFFDENNKPRAGVLKVNGKWYTTSAGGATYHGTLTKVSGKYVFTPYRYFNAKGVPQSGGKYIRAYSKDDSIATGIAYVSNPKTKQGDYFMFDANGYRVAPETIAKKSSWGIYTWGDKNYAVYKGVGKVYNYKNKVAGLNMGNQLVKVKKGVIIKSKKKGTSDANLKKVKMGKTAGVKVQAATGKVTVTWKKTAKAKGYYVLRSTLKNDGYEHIKDVKSGAKTKFVDKTAVAGTKYFYKVQAYKKFVGCKFAGKASKQVAVTAA